MTAHAEMRQAIEAKHLNNNVCHQPCCSDSGCPGCKAWQLLDDLAPTWLAELLEENERLHAAIRAWAIAFNAMDGPERSDAAYKAAIEQLWEIATAAAFTGLPTHG
jgi:hypothetical protein